MFILKSSWLESTLYSQSLHFHSLTLTLYESITLALSTAIHHHEAPLLSVDTIEDLDHDSIEGTEHHSMNHDFSQPLNKKWETLDSSPTCQESQICKQRVWICLVHIRSISLDLDLNSTTIVPWFGSQFNNEESHTLRIIGTHAHPH